MIPGETLATGASPICPDCDVTVSLGVMHSGGGYYVGTKCQCETGGPYTRETGYYKEELEAEMALTRILNGKTEDLRR